ERQPLHLRAGLSGCHALSASDPAGGNGGARGRHLRGLGDRCHGVRPVCSRALRAAPPTARRNQDELLPEALPSLRPRRRRAGAVVRIRIRTVSDVEGEASTVVTVARRVLEQTSTAENATNPFSDDLMVWVGQVVHEDINLFEGPELLATSQRDLYASGLLPTRTPARAYRAIALSRLPTFVGEEWLGRFGYVVAAAPMPAAGRDYVLSVPLASRQREIERELDELYRGVLVGAMFVVLFAAGLGASAAGRVSDPVSRLSRATRLIAAGQLDVRLVAETADELSRLIDDFNTMAATLAAQRTELA